jgi:uracil-DNA glycosylase family 4
MGFFHQANKPERLTGKINTSVELLHRMGCKACPLNNAPVRNGKMAPHGSAEPLVYVLGSTPTVKSDRIGKPWTGSGKEAFLALTPRGKRDLIRYSNIVRTAGGKTITPTMMECCRPSIIADIEATKPIAIFGFGEDVLKWAINQSGIRKWTGRMMPIKVGTHECWFFPFSDPSILARTRKQEWNVSEEEFAWEFQVKRAWAVIDDLPKPLVDGKAEALFGLKYIDGSGGDRDLDRVQAVFDKMSAEKVVGIDWETNRLRGFNRGSKLLTMALSCVGETWGIAIAHSKAFWTKAQRKELHTMIADFLYTAKCRLVSHNLAFELEWSALFYGRDVARASRWEDTVTQAWLIDERNKMGKPDCLALEFLTILYFGINIKALNDLDTKTLDDAPLDRVLEYNAIDAKYHLHLFLAQDDVIVAEGLVKQYEQMLARVPTCVLTSIKGVPIRQATVRKFKKHYERNIKLIEADIAATSAAKAFKRQMGKPFEPSNPKDVLALITKVLKEDATNKDDKQSSGWEVLDRISDPIAELIIEHRSDAKALSTYVMPVLEGSPLVFEDGMIHPQISTTRTQTSRTASDEPNSQNWPKHDGGAVVRAQVGPDDPDERIVSFDFAGIQARNIAMESLDQAFIKSFWDEEDIHMRWAKRSIELFPRYQNIKGMAEFKADKVKAKAARQHSKNNFVFPTFFGAQPRGISINTGIAQDDVAMMQEELFEEYPDIHAWQERIKHHYAKHGWITGLTGIRRRAPCSPNQLINAPIQADEAWIVCDAFTRLSKTGDERLQANMEIHDDLTFIWHKDDIDRLAPKVIKAMISVPFKWAHVVPIAVEMLVGKDWSKSKEVGKFSSATYDKKGYSRAEFE